MSAPRSQEPDPSGFPDIQSSFFERLGKQVPPVDLPGGATLDAEAASSPRSSGAQWLADAVTSAERRRYVRRSELGRGGMGAVYEVLDTDLRRILAMKVALAKPGQTKGQGSDPEQALLARFLEEAQVTGQLDHPGIVPLHEVGMDASGQVYFTMRLVKGQDLHKVFEHARQGTEGWTQERAIVALLRVCEAMGYAHSKGVVHRDLKPANVMTGRFGEVYVMDWGLAKVMGRPDSARRSDVPTGSILLTTRRGEDDALATQEGTALGTPVYMSPEQARGELDKITPQSDVYSVGAMLYHLAAGRPPYLVTGARIPAGQVLAWVIEGPPKPLREVAPDVAPELAAICEKAMAREPAQRYPDMLALAEDLRAFLVGRPVTALQVSGFLRFLRWVRRNPMPTAALIALALGAGLGLWRLGAVSRSLVEQSAIESAELESQLLQEVNSFYVEAVASRVDRQHVQVTSEWRDQPHAIPIPATFLTELGDRVTDRAGRVRIQHYSDFPFQNRERGPLDDFQLAALADLRRTPEVPATRFEDMEGEPVLRYAVARKMEQGCVDCHNTHPQSTKKDWKVGEVRGVLEIVRPLAGDELRIQKGLRGTLILVTAVVGGLFLAALLGVLAFTRREAVRH